MERSLVPMIVLAFLFAGTADLEMRYPGKDWWLRADLPGFTVGDPQESGVRDSVTLKAYEAESGTLLSVRLEPAAESDSAADLREQRFRELKVRRRGELTAVLREPWGQLLLLDFFMPLVDGLEVDQRHVYGFAVHDGVRIELHLTKPQYVDEDGPQFDAILDSIRLE